MKANEVRQTFLDFFKSKGHTIVPSASLIPENDPTLLFTNAGMNQFKDVFLGVGKRDYVRVANTQKCMRVSGKHNDLEDVGKDGYHHTFFEMLGNWSFGDYYKKEAIMWAWELLTKVWGLPKDKLYATVHFNDDEAFSLWGEVTDIDKTHILRFGDKDNFWEMGATGPCGPCSEIHIDRGEDACDKKHIPGHKCEVNGGCARFIELWNLVFIQYNREEDGSLTPLPSKHVDTGMGFERIVSVLQGKISNYDTDLFEKIIASIENLSGEKFSKENAVPIRVIADHIRSLTFAMADGVMPSNEGRGYVIRKILRRAIRYGRYIGFDSPFLHKIVDAVALTYDGVFSEVNERKEMIKSLIFSEEEAFYRTIHRGLDKINEMVDLCHKENRKILRGEEVFFLYDSLGVPIDFIRDVASDEKITIDEEGFNRLMEKQRERARAHWKGEGIDVSFIKGKVAKTEYAGDENFSLTSKILILLKEKEEVKELKEGESGGVVVEKTPFYGEKGGQVGDRGFIKKGDNIFEVIDTKIADEIYLHTGVVKKGKFNQSDEVILEIDADRRAKIRRNHTCTHLLHRSLKKVLGEHVAQAGSLVGPEGFRFDFTHFKALTKDEIEQIENEVNRIILSNLPVKISFMSKDEAVKNGAVAIFEEKYGEIVRVVEVEGYSKELCGGSHVRSTGEIGLFKITSESSISAGTRRIEGLTGTGLFEYLRKIYYIINGISLSLNVSEDKILDKIKSLNEELKLKDKEILSLKKQLALSRIEKIIQEAEIVGEAKVFIKEEDINIEDMVNLVDLYRDKVANGMILLISRASDEKVNIVCGVGKSLVPKIKARDLTKKVAQILGGGGGGRDDFAQAGGKNPDKIKEAIDFAKNFVLTSIG